MDTANALAELYSDLAAAQTPEEIEFIERKIAALRAA